MRPLIINGSMDLTATMRKTPSFFRADGKVDKGCGRNLVEVVAGNSSHLFPTV